MLLTDKLSRAYYLIAFLNFVSTPTCRLLWSCEHEKVKRSIPFSIGFISCLYGSCNGGQHDNSLCKLFPSMDTEQNDWTMNFLIRGFWCSKCDMRIIRTHEMHKVIIPSPETKHSDFTPEDTFMNLQSLFFKLIYDESSEEVQIACVQNIRRILLHVPTHTLIKSRYEWTKCIDYLLLCRNKGIREAFCSQVSSFSEDSVLTCLFPVEDVDGKNKEQMFLDIIKHALAAAKDPEIFETLLESTAEIMSSVDIHNQLFLFSLILLVDQLDNPHVTVRMNASRLIHKSCYYHLKGGLEQILSRAVHARNELYDYLSMRLVNRPEMIREVAESVFGIEMENLLKKMVPVVLPKLVVSQKDNEKAVCNLLELAKSLNTDLIPLIVNWLPKVLAFTLHRANEVELLAALQFYKEHTGSDSQEIFAAALPALLDELICFLEGGDSEEIERRYANSNFF